MVRGRVHTKLGNFPPVPAASVIVNYFAAGPWTHQLGGHAHRVYVSPPAFGILQITLGAAREEVDRIAQLTLCTMPEKVKLRYHKVK